MVYYLVLFLQLTLAFVSAAPPTSPFVIGAAFSLKNPGTLVQFDLQNPNTYLNSIKNEYVEDMAFIAVNDASSEVYFEAVDESGGYLLIYDAVSLKLKNITDLGDFVVEDMAWDPTLNGGTLIAFGGVSGSDYFSLATIDIKSGTATSKIVFKDVEDVGESTFGYDAVNHRYIIAGGLASGCEYIIVDTTNFNISNIFKYDCTSGGPESDRTPVNSEYSPITNQLIGIINDQSVYVWNLDTWKFTFLFNVSYPGTFRILGPSMIITDNSGNFDTYYTQMSTHAPVSTNLIEVILPRNGNPSFKNYPPNPVGDIINLMALVKVTK